MEIRDHRSPGWLWADRDIIKTDGAELGPYGIAVYMALCSFAGQDQKAWPSLSTIAEMIGCSRRQVIRKIQQLEEMGWISVEQRRTKAGDHTSNAYHLLSNPHARDERSGDSQSSHGDRGAPEVKPMKNIPLSSSDDNGARYTCPECSRSFKSKGGLTRHRRAKHNIDQRHPALIAYHEVTGYNPVPGVRIAIETSVTKEVEFWREVVEAYCGLGWNPRNVGAMLEFYKKHQIPSVKGGNGNGRDPQLRRAGGRALGPEEEDPTAIYARAMYASQRHTQGP